MSEVTRTFETLIRSGQIEEAKSGLNRYRDFIRDALFLQACEHVDVSDMRRGQVAAIIHGYRYGKHVVTHNRETGEVWLNDGTWIEPNVRAAPIESLEALSKIPKTYGS